MTSALYVQTRKEVRALLPWWLGVMLATVAMSYVAAQSAGLPFFRHEQQAWLVMAYAAGVVVLAALSVGQELTHGTFAALLVQPVERRRVLWTKIAVLASLLVALGIVGEAGFPRGSLPADIALRPLSIWGPVAIGIGLVPLFTLLTRKPLAGPVFGLVVPPPCLRIQFRALSLARKRQGEKKAEMGHNSPETCRHTGVRLS